MTAPAERRICQCHARMAGECACGAWDESADVDPVIVQLQAENAELSTKLSALEQECGRMEIERDAYRSALCDLVAARKLAPEWTGADSLWGNARELLKSGPAATTKEAGLMHGMDPHDEIAYWRQRVVMAEAEADGMRSTLRRTYDTVCALTLTPNIDRAVWASLCSLHSQLAVALNRCIDTALATTKKDGQA